MPIQKIELTDIRDNMSGLFDLFICSSSFEDRCISIPMSIDIAKMHRTLILSNLDYSDYVGLNQKKLSDLFGGKGKVIGVKSSDPLFTADTIKNCLHDERSYGHADSVVIDITTLTHETLLILLRLLRIELPDATIKGVYANASEYSVGDTVQHKWLSRGISEVRSVLGFPGNIIPSRKTHLIVIVGYEHERAIGLIDFMEPNSIALGFGRSGSATTEKDKDANEHYMHLVAQMATSFSVVNQFEIPCDNPYGTQDELQKQIKAAGDVNIVIAPMNNKLSTIGAAWTAFENGDVQICYARALSYNYTGYSMPGAHCYILDLKWKDKVHGGSGLTSAVMNPTF